MSFVKLALGPTDVVLGTVTKKAVQVSLGPAAIRALGWSEDDPNISVAVGDGEDAGWLRVFLDEEGSTPEEVGGRIEVVVPRSAVPDLEPCRSSSLVWRTADGGIDVRLPTVAAKPKLRSVPSSNRPQLQVLAESLPEVVGPPALYGELHREAWAAGIEVHFLSNGDVVVAGKVCSIDDVESAVRRAGERRTADVSRATASAA